MIVDSIRSQFPALREKTFLDSAGVSLAPFAAAQAIGEFLEMAVYCPARSSTFHHNESVRPVLRPPLAGYLSLESDTDVSLLFWSWMQNV
jgi:selenocysteine lyase/cysteine desulfurase